MKEVFVILNEVKDLAFFTQDSSQKKLRMTGNVGLNPFASLQGQVKRILFEHDEPTYGILDPLLGGGIKGGGFVILRNEGSCFFHLKILRKKA
jgi:hypothetical protein